jgi:CBS-domain-containing membrane protein
MNVGDAMKGEVRTALINDTLSLAMRIMLGARVSGLPVVDEEGSLVGMLTEGDLMRRAELGTARHRARWLEIVLGPRRMAQEYVESHSRRVGDLMTTDVLTIEESAPLEDAVALLEKRHFKRLPVTRRGVWSAC